MRKLGFLSLLPLAAIALLITVGCGGSSDKGKREVKDR